VRRTDSVTFALPKHVHDLLSLPVRRTGTQSPCMPRPARPVRRTGTQSLPIQEQNQ
jgi:hypothetical protein